jgi:protein SCO1/2
VDKTRSVLMYVVLALAAALAGVLVSRQFGDDTVTLASGTWLPQPRPVAAFSLVDQDGHPFDAARLAEGPSLLFFGFTHCPDVCPTTLALLAQLDHDPPVPSLRTILVTVDPARDAPEAMRRYVGAFSPRMIGLTGEDAQIDALMRSVGAVRMVREGPGGIPLVDHSPHLHLLDSQGRQVAVFTPPLDIQAIREDLRTARRELESGS